jgi:hypothetical protein
MSNSYDLLGISAEASPSQIKAAYHQKLREFPAHTHPTEFKAIRSAYEAIQKGEVNQKRSFFEMPPIEATIEPEIIQDLKTKLTQQLEVSLQDMLRLTF